MCPSLPSARWLSSLIVIFNAPAFQCAAPLDLFFRLRRLRRILGKTSKEEERDLVLKALATSDLLEISENGLRIQKKDTQGGRPLLPLSTFNGAA